MSGVLTAYSDCQVAPRQKFSTARWHISHSDKLFISNIAVRVRQHSIALDWKARLSHAQKSYTSWNGVCSKTQRRSWSAGQQGQDLHWEVMPQWGAAKTMRLPRTWDPLEDRWQSQHQPLWDLRPPLCARSASARTAIWSGKLQVIEAWPLANPPKRWSAAIILHVGMMLQDDTHCVIYLPASVLSLIFFLCNIFAGTPSLASNTSHVRCQAIAYKLFDESCVRWVLVSCSIHYSVKFDADP